MIVEVYPEDEGEYMCKAENRLGAAITHCHVFVKCKLKNRPYDLCRTLKIHLNIIKHILYEILFVVPSSSDEETEKLISKHTQKLVTQEPIKIKEHSKFTERIKVQSKPKPVKPYELHRAEVYARQTSVPRGMKMEIAIPAQKKPQPLYKESRALTLKRQVEERVHSNQTLQQTLQHPGTLGQRRFSETLSIDHKSKKPLPQVNITHYYHLCF